MSEGLQSGLPPEALEALRRLNLTDYEPPADHTDVPGKITLKDRPYADLLHSQPELAAAITDTMQRIAEHDIEVPIFHITSRAIRYPDGSEQSTGYLENIAQNGLRARDTNVAALVERGDTTHIASPEYFAQNPHKLLRSMAESLGHYSHHGSRTNKASLGGMREAGVGTPTMLVIDATDVPLVPGTDYDDHFMLGETVPASKIMGYVDLAGRKPINPEDVAAVTYDYLDAINDHIQPQDQYPVSSSQQ